MLLLFLVVGICGASYWYNSKNAENVFLDLASGAENRGELSDQIAWLRRYSLLRPDDQEAISAVAFAADAAVDKTSPEKRYFALDTARGQLGNAIARLDGQDEELVLDLRLKLIERLLELGSVRPQWFLEAERQIFEVEAEPESVQVSKQLARALLGQVDAGIYKRRKQDEYAKDTDYWRWLASQNPGSVLLTAMDKNPVDLDLIALFLDKSFNQIDLFTQNLQIESQERLKTETDRIQADLDRRIQNTIHFLEDRMDGRSKWMLFNAYARHGTSEQADQFLAEEVNAAAERLSEADLAEADAADQSDSSSGVAPDSLWDYLFVFQAAEKFQKTDPALAQDLFTRLTLLELKGIPESVKENVFIKNGRMYLEAGDIPQAIATWKSGLQKFPESLKLNYSIATGLLSADPNSRETRASFKRLKDTVDSISKKQRQLVGSNGSMQGWMQTERNLEAAKWQLGVIEATFMLRDENYAGAAEKLQVAMDTEAEVDTVARVWVAEQLANLHSRNGQWDTAASVLENAINLDPGNTNLRIKAARCWERAGNRFQASGQWQSIGASDSISLQAAALQSEFNYQMQLSSREQDLGYLRNQIRAFRSDHWDEDTDLNRLGVSETDSANAIVAALVCSIPTEGNDLYAYLKSKEFAAKLAVMSDQLANNQHIQAFASQQLTALGRELEANRALSRLKDCIGSDSTLFKVTEARIDAIKGDPLAAAELVAAQAKRDVQQEGKLLSMAAGYALSGNAVEKAYGFLQMIPEKNQNLEILFNLAELSRNLSVDSPLVKDSKFANTPEDLSKHWEEKLKKQEGENGSYWKYLEAFRLSQELENNPELLGSDPSKLTSLQDSVEQIIEKRPLWGIALSLRGRLEALEAQQLADYPTDGNLKSIDSLREQAVNSLRVGIASGDNGASTKDMLFTLLLSLNRLAEAEELLSRTEASFDSNNDANVGIKIALANQQRDFKRGLSLAEKVVANAPDDFGSHLILAQSAIILARNSVNEQTRESNFEKAAAEIQKAYDLTTKDELGVFSAELELALAKNDQVQLATLMKRIDDSMLSPLDKAALKYRGYEASGQYEMALRMLEEAFRYRKTAKNQLAQAKLYERLDRPRNVQQALRKAIELDPKNDDLRYMLARSLTTNNLDQIDWEEIAQLLSGSNGDTWKSKLRYAALLYNQKDAESKQEAADVLRNLFMKDNEIGKDSGRVLALVLQEQLKTDPPEDLEARESMSKEVRSVYTGLITDGEARPSDLFHYASFLLNQWRPDDRGEIEDLIAQMTASRSGTLMAIEIAIRLSRASSGKDSIPEAVRDWAEKASRGGFLKPKEVEMSAGLGLVSVGFQEEALPYMKRAYELDRNTLAQYVRTLMQLKRLDQAIELCVNQFNELGDYASANIMLEVFISQSKTLTPSQHRLVQSVVLKHADKMDVLENAGTLYLQQEDFENAVPLFEKVLRIDPNRVRAMNNLAMALSEVPDRAEAGIPWIDRAIHLVGENPELLDTKGVVLLKAGRLEEAFDAFKKAYDQTNDPRFQFHLIVARVAQNKIVEAKDLWSELNLDNLDLSALTISERVQLDELKRDFGS